MANPADARPGNIINSTNGQVGENVSYTAYVGFIPVNPGEKYTLSGVNLHKREEGNSQAAYVNVVEYSGTHYSDYLRKLVNSQSSDNSYTFTIGSDAKYIRFCVGVGATDVQLETGTAATSYAEYQGDTYTFTFPNDAGTVYVGTLDVLSGVLTVTHAGISLDGTQGGIYQNNGQTAISTRAIVTVTGKADGTTGFISDKFAIRSDTDIVGKMTGRAASNKVEFFLPNTVPDTSAGVIAWFTDNPTQLVFPLAEPVTYQLTAQEVTALIGQNNIFADTGNVSVQYKVKEDLV